MQLVKHEDESERSPPLPLNCFLQEENDSCLVIYSRCSVSDSDLEPGLIDPSFSVLFSSVEVQRVDVKAIT